MPTYSSDRDVLLACLDSVRDQLYSNWEICVCDDASPETHVRETLQAYAANELRLRWTVAEQNLNISGASNLAADLATGQVIALLDHDDLLHPHALAELAICYAENPSADIVYSDDDKIDMDGRRYDPQFKPDWSPVLLLSFMYFSHLFSFRRELFQKVGGFRLGFEGSQDYDLALRMSELARQVHHIPRVLYHWRAAPGSTALSADTKPESFERGRRAVQDAFDRRGIKAEAIHPDWASRARVGIFEPHFPDRGPSVCIIVPTRNKVDLLRVCLESLKKTTYENYEVLVIDNDSDEPETLDYLNSIPYRVMRISSPAEGFSFSYLNNVAAGATEADFLLLLNNDTAVRAPRWLSQMVGYGQMQDVGAVGARLLYEDGRLQHAGITHGLHEGMAGHSFKLLPAHEHGYLSLALTSRECAGVTAACMLTRRVLYKALGGLDDVRFRVAYNDVDYCYRVIDAGFSCIQCGSAELFHYEGKTRGFSDNPTEERDMRRKYRTRKDPFYNPNLSLSNEWFEVARVHPRLTRATPPKTAFVSHNLNHEGAPNSLFELAVGLHRRGEIDAVCLSPRDGPLAANYRDEGLGVGFLENPVREFPAGNEFDARLRRLGQSLLYTGIEVVVANTAEMFWVVLAARTVGIPVIWIIRESEPWQTYYNQFPRHLADLAYDAFSYPYKIVFVAQATLEAWRPMDYLHSFTLIRNGLDVRRLAGLLGGDRSEARQVMYAGEQDCVFTCVGTVCDRKGQIDLVRAFSRLPGALARRAKVFIVGDRPSDYSNIMHVEIAALPADRRDRVVVIGETEKAKTFFRGADVFVCASRVESYPRVTLEAMAAGLPIITTGVWGILEQVRANYNALIYEPADIETLAVHMATMISEPKTRSLFAARALPVFESLPDFDYMCDSYAMLIHQAVGSREPNSSG
jgi:GT2 family glycosyltransferase/glycosyltransferase involved in cell wall biosynthesis